MPNKVYSAPETPVVFQASGGDVTFTLTNLGFGAGRVSAQRDRGRKQTAFAQYHGRRSIRNRPSDREIVEVYLFSEMEPLWMEPSERPTPH